MESRIGCVWGRGVWMMVRLLLFVLCVLAGPVQGGAEESAVKSDMSQLQPGLATVYIEKKYRNVDQVPTGEAAHKAGYQGKPVLLLNHLSGKEEFVFDSGRSQGVAMVMNGFLHLDKQGTYLWHAMANDGIRMFINNKMIFEDPKVHKDRLTPTGTLQVDESGWYPVNIIYFQRKGTAALKLYWQPPAAKEFTLVPAEVYWH